MIVDYLLIGIFFFLLLAWGVACIVWPQRVHPMTTNYVARLHMSEKGRNVYTRVNGVVIIAFTLIFGFFVIKNFR